MHPTEMQILEAAGEIVGVLGAGDRESFGFQWPDSLAHAQRTVSITVGKEGLPGGEPPPPENTFTRCVLGF